MSRILILSLIFPPDGVSSAQLLGEIAEDLHLADNEVEVFTTSPHYNADEAALASQPITWSWHRLTGVSDYRGIRVTHLRMPPKSAGSVGRIFQWLWFHLGTAVLMPSRLRRLDSVLTISPPPTVAIVGGIAARISRARLVFCVWELYPEILVALDVVRRGSLLHRVLERLERTTYALSDVISVLHEPMREQVMEKYPEFADRIEVVPTFADVDFLRPLDRETALRSEVGIPADRIVVGYAGNLGVSEDLRPVLNAAAELPDVHFLICGDGSDRQGLEEVVGDLGLSNVDFTGQLPYQRVPEIIASCDIALVVLSTGVGSEALPSKVYRTMACGRPILAVCDDDTPLASLVRSESLGVVADPRSATSIANAIRVLAEDEGKRQAMSNAARTIAVEKFSRGAVTSRYEQLLNEGVQ